MGALVVLKAIVQPLLCIERKFTYELCHFNVDDSVVFSIFTILWNHYHEF